MRKKLRQMVYYELDDYCDKAMSMSDTEYLDGYPVWIVLNCIADEYKRRTTYRPLLGGYTS